MEWKFINYIFPLKVEMRFVTLAPRGGNFVFEMCRVRRYLFDAILNLCNNFNFSTKHNTVLVSCSPNPILKCMFLSFDSTLFLLFFIIFVAAFTCLCNMYVLWLLSLHLLLSLHCLLLQYSSAPSHPAEFGLYFLSTYLCLSLCLEAGFSIHVICN